MNPRNIISSIIAVLLLALVAWRYGAFHRDDPVVKEMKQLAEQPRSKENRDAMRSAVEKQTAGMTDEQKFGFFEKMAPVFVPLMAKRFEQEYDKFMTLSKAEQKKELDKRIDEMRKRGGPGGPGRPGGRGGPPALPPAKAAEMQKKMLDWTTPDQRAKFENGIRLMNDRMQQRGFDPLPAPGGGFF